MSVIYLTSRQVLSRYSISDATLYRWIRDPEVQFPQPSIVKKRRFFLEADLIAWERSRVGKAVA